MKRSIEGERQFTGGNSRPGSVRGLRRKRASVFMILICLCILGLFSYLGSTGTDHYNSTSPVNHESTRNDGQNQSVEDDVVYDASQASSPSCISNPDSIPEYDGRDYILLNNGKPNFTEWDLVNIKGQTFSQLDGLGRCGTAVAMLDRSMMPEEERGSIGSVKPTGWVQNKYAGIVNSNPPYLYNRCHLIAYALTGENANEQNLITGTRYLNVSIMLSWEEEVMKYLDDSDHHVLYRVTPYFRENELLARGIEMEAYSVEDDGEDICFHVFCYNVQPGVVLDYETGDNRAE